MYIKEVVETIDTLFADRALELFNSYDGFYIFLALSLINGVVLVFKYHKFDWGYWDYISTVLLILFSTFLFLYLSTLWFQKWFYAIDIYSIIFGLKVASLGALYYFAFLLAIYVKGISSYFNSLRVDYTVLTLLNFFIFFVVFVVSTAFAYILDLIL